MALCYKDMTFCEAECVNERCFRNFNTKVLKAAKEWWSHDPENVPIAFTDFSEGCDSFLPHPESFRG